MSVPRPFIDLYRAEQRLLGGMDNEAEPHAAIFDGSSEPRITYTPRDRVGLALSGGGIRSATFNLGVLQGLNKLRLLPFVDYLSTVSGGGYIGGWWTAWRSRPEHRDHLLDQPFPAVVAGVEAAEVRHLREFSRFLLPRVGFFDIDTWNAVVIVLCGALIGIAAANAILMGCMFIWIMLAAILLQSVPSVSAWVIAAVTLSVLLLTEWLWQRRTSMVAIPVSLVENYLIVFLCAGFPVLFCSLIWGMLYNPPTALQEGALTAAIHQQSGWPIDINDWGLRFSEEGLDHNWRLLYPTATWLATAGAMMVGRFLFSRFRDGRRIASFVCRRPVINVRAGRSWIQLWGRTTGRLLAMAVIWFLFAIVAAAALYIYRSGNAKFLAGVASVLSALFAWARRLHPATASRPETRRLSDKLRPLLPQVLAYVALAAGSIFATWLMIWLFNHWGVVWFIVAWLSFAGVFLICFDPEVMGLHAFYRARIARTYLGASNPAATHVNLNRGTDRRPGDDVELAKTRLGSRKLLHLVCCTANGLADDPLGTLVRGGRSAVLSAHGISIGDCWGWAPGLRLATALTASGAAFNTCMGSASMRLGPAVRFLMAALDFRLGLWLEHPRSANRRSLAHALPGLLFLKEMAGLVTCSGMVADRRPGHVHFSDGGHFENLGLYELVRRHCRYIIVSDCGEDFEVAFDDFGNAVRRIREDFGVEIDIDIDPLRPQASGLARQHMAAGIIHYDRQRPNDRGILLYFKPALLGNEPDDITQYKARNAYFPHETTGDQFYDEAQWEAYRRLGEHSVQAGLGFLGQESDRRAHEVFQAAHQRWYPTPLSLHEERDRLAARYGEFERQATANGSAFLLEELFPETRAIRLPVPSSRPMTSQQLAGSLPILLELARFMEDVVTCCRLDTHLQHPLNAGWGNVLQRWVATRLFRFWWPIIKPLHGRRLQAFVEERLQFIPGPQIVGNLTSAPVTTHADLPPGPASEAWRLFRAHEPAQAATAFSYLLSLADQADQFEVQIGLAIVDLSQPNIARWRSDRFFVLPGLWGTDLGDDFMEAMVGEIFAAQGLNRARCRVELATHDAGQDATELLHADLIDFYLGAGFRLGADGQHLWRDR